LHSSPIVKSVNCKTRLKKDKNLEKSAAVNNASGEPNQAVPRFLRGTRGSDPFVKICGITNAADAETAIECGADALGFNLFPDSRRYIDINAARVWIEALPDHVARVLVGVNPSFEQAFEWLTDQTFHAIQIHGENWRPFASRLAERNKPVVAAISVKDEDSVAALDWFNGFALLFDGYRPGDFGGTGQRFPWELLRRYRIPRPAILAGGLTPENVAAAIRTVDPYAVDVASGVEDKPGKKDRNKLRDFIAAVRATRVSSE
jgi:phosphoribosylanthranilate isomerase